MQIPQVGVLEVRRLRSRALGMAALLCAVALIVGCGGAEPTDTPSSPASQAPGTTTTNPDPVRAAADKALAAYRGMWAAYQEAGKVPNPDDPALADFATGSALTTLTSGLKSIKDRGLVIKGDVVLNPAVTAFMPADIPTTVEITDCADSTNSLLYRSSGELYNSDPGGRRRVKATVQDTGGGTWRVMSFGVQDVGSC